MSEQPWETAAKEIAVQRGAEELAQLRADNRIMKDALIEIAGMRLLQMSVDYSPKAIARNALKKVNR